MVEWLRSESARLTGHHRKMDRKTNAKTQANHALAAHASAWSAREVGNLFVRFSQSLRKTSAARGAAIGYLSWSLLHMQRTRPSRSGCNRGPSWAGSLSFGS
jgi:hypothetical protein